MDKAELRRLAGAARKFYEKAVYDADESQAWEDFVEACRPATIIELLDENEVLKCCGNCKYSQIDKEWKALCCGLKPSLKVSKVYDCNKWQRVK